MKKLVFAFLLLSAFLPNWCLAQRSCAFEDNGIRTAEEIEVARLASSAHKVTGNVRIIPVVVSVFYSTAGAASNISDAQVASGITILNEGFRAQYGGVDTEIEFCLSGIKRFLDPNSATAYIGGNELSLKTIAQEDPTRFYNVYIVEQIYTPAGDSAEGYTFTPKIMTLDDRYDGTLLKHFFWGNIGTGATNNDYNLGRIAIHEAGHWLNLFHPFGTCDYDWNCEAENDCCCDTPPLTERNNTRCNKRKNTCRTDNPDERDPIHNYMGYTPDECRYEFTPCQSARMNYTLDVLRPGASFESGDCPAFKWAGSLAQSDSPSFNVSLFPNPAHETATIRLNVIGKETPCSIDIYDAQGKLVASLASKSVLAEGMHEYKFDAPAPGMYLARVASPWAAKTIKLVSLAK